MVILCNKFIIYTYICPVFNYKAFLNDVLLPNKKKRKNKQNRFTVSNRLVLVYNIQSSIFTIFLILSLRRFSSTPPNEETQYFPVGLVHFPRVDLR